MVRVLLHKFLIRYTPDHDTSSHRHPHAGTSGRIASVGGVSVQLARKTEATLQRPRIDLSTYFNGTLNISIAPLEFEMTKPEFTFALVEWTDLHPPETFSFSRCKVRFEGKAYEGWVYYPHPETKKTHFQNPSLIEVITYEIANLKYGDAIEIEVNPLEIKIS